MKALGVARPANAHVLGFVLFAYISFLALVFALKNTSKHKKLLRVERATAALARVPTAPVGRSLTTEEKDTRHRNVEVVLNDLLASTDKVLGVVRPFSRSVQTAWILVPDGKTADFRTIHFVATRNDADYSEVALKHRPKLWDKPAFEKIWSEWQRDEPQRAKDFTWFARRRHLKAMKGKLRECGSLTGLIFEQDKARAYKNVIQCEVFDGSYEDLIPETDRQRLSFKSAAGVALKVGGKPVAVLRLYGNVRRSFGEPDTTALRIWGHMLAPIVQANLELGMYN